jgi:hypothetical protein
MGLLSVTVGLTVAMLGSAALAMVCVLALWAFSRVAVGSGNPQPLTPPRHPADRPREGQA